MKERFDVVVVIPVGPGTIPEFVTDTIDSFIFYSACAFKIIIADDSHEGIGDYLVKKYPALAIVYTTKPMGAMAGLYITLSLAYQYALVNYDFDLLFKLDTDALIIGAEPENEPLQLFNCNPGAGIAGQYPLDYQGNMWDRGWPRARIINGTMTWKFIRRPMANLALRKLYLTALKNGYTTGESVFGGAYFMNKHLIAALYRYKLLPAYALQKLNLGEDHLFGLLAKALGFELADLASANRPFACSWKGLPASPEQLYNEGRKIIHSTRSWDGMNEVDIRSWFRAKRTTAAARTGS